MPRVKLVMDGQRLLRARELDLWCDRDEQSQSVKGTGCKSDPVNGKPWRILTGGRPQHATGFS